MCVCGCTCANMMMSSIAVDVQHFIVHIRFLSRWPKSYLSFLKASLGSDPFWLCIPPFFVYCLVVMLKLSVPIFSRMINQMLDTSTSSKIHIAKVSFQSPNHNIQNQVPSPTNTLWPDSLKACTMLLRNCWIYRFLFKNFLHPKCVCQAQHMIRSLQ